LIIISVNKTLLILKEMDSDFDRVVRALEAIELFLFERPCSPDNRERNYLDRDVAVMIEFLHTYANTRVCGEERPVCWRHLCEFAARMEIAAGAASATPWPEFIELVRAVPLSRA
jgi:hypothetical protein